MLISLKTTIVGLLVGFVSGLFGKGGSAIATPLLQLVGVSAYSAIASPLPATIPGTLIASLAYLREGLYQKKVIYWSIAVGIPTTFLGAWLSKFVGGTPLLIASNLVLIFLSIPFLYSIAKKTKRTSDEIVESKSAALQNPLNEAHLILVAAAVGLISGMLANSGGFLLAPLYHKVLKLPLKSAFSCSLLVSAALAIPGTLVHLWLGHIDWRIVFFFGLGSIPLSYAGAKITLKMPVQILEPLFGLMLILVGTVGFFDAIK